MTRTESTVEPRWLDDEEMAAWLPFVQLLYLLPQELDRQLREEMGVSHTWYSMLAALSAAPDRTLAMGELARSSMTSPSRLTHAIATMEKRGWVVRRPCPTDKRSQFAVLTDEGFATLEAIAPSHVAEVRRTVFDRLDREQVDQLRRIALTLLEGLG
ncbi:MAG TPA: MarR family transcriptional regulator [Nocardioides sp.]|nr:MarR family transcriptional regulator [Nocardioides sp.]